MSNKQNDSDDIIIDPLELESIELDEDEFYSMIQLSNDIELQSDFLEE